MPRENPPKGSESRAATRRCARNPTRQTLPGCWARERCGAVARLRPITTSRSRRVVMWWPSRPKRTILKNGICKCPSGAALKRSAVPLLVQARCASCSFDHLVGAQQQFLRDGESERPRGPAVDDHLEFRGLLYWEVARLGALEDFVHIGGCAPVMIGEVLPIIHQAAGL